MPHPVFDAAHRVGVLSRSHDTADTLRVPRHLLPADARSPAGPARIDLPPGAAVRREMTSRLATDALPPGARSSRQDGIARWLRSWMHRHAVRLERALRP